MNYETQHPGEKVPTEVWQAPRCCISTVVQNAAGYEICFTLTAPSLVFSNGKRSGPPILCERAAPTHCELCSSTTGSAGFVRYRKSPGPWSCPDRNPSRDHCSRAGLDWPLLWPTPLVYVQSAAPDKLVPAALAYSCSISQFQDVDVHQFIGWLVRS